jgi:hypothetical protein
MILNPTAMKPHNTSILFFLLNITFFLFVAARYDDEQSFDKITVKEFELVGPDGKRRASIKVEPEGDVVLRLMDKTGDIRVKLAAGEDGSGLVLLNESTEPAIHALSKKNGGKVTLLDESGKKREL